MGICGTFRLTFETRDFKYIIGTVPQESGRVVTLPSVPIRVPRTPQAESELLTSAEEANIPTNRPRSEPFNCQIEIIDTFIASRIKISYEGHFKSNAQVGITAD